jgi:hypothetical protein
MFVNSLAYVIYDSNIKMMQNRTSMRKAMFGLVVKDGMEWNGVVINYVPLFGYTKNEWSGMEYNGTHSITYHPIF